MEKSPLRDATEENQSLAIEAPTVALDSDSLGFRGHCSTLQDIVAEDELLRFPKARESLTETP